MKVEATLVSDVVQCLRGITPPVRSYFVQRLLHVPHHTDMRAVELIDAEGVVACVLVKQLKGVLEPCCQVLTRIERAVPHAQNEFFYGLVELFAPLMNVTNHAVHPMIPAPQFSIEQSPLVQQVLEEQKVFAPIYDEEFMVNASQHVLIATQPNHQQIEHVSKMEMESKTPAVDHRNAYNAIPTSSNNKGKSNSIFHHLANSLKQEMKMKKTTQTIQFEAHSKFVSENTSVEHPQANFIMTPIRNTNLNVQTSQKVTNGLRVPDSHDSIILLSSSGSKSPQFYQNTVATQQLEQYNQSCQVDTESSDRNENATENNDEQNCHQRECGNNNHNDYICCKSGEASRCDENEREADRGEGGWVEVIVSEPVTQSSCSHNHITQKRVANTLNKNDNPISLSQTSSNLYMAPTPSEKRFFPPGQKSFVESPIPYSHHNFNQNHVNTIQSPLLQQHNTLHQQCVQHKHQGPQSNVNDFLDVYCKLNATVQTNRFPCINDNDMSTNVLLDEDQWSELLRSIKGDPCTMQLAQAIANLRTVFFEKLLHMRLPLYASSAVENVSQAFIKCLHRQQVQQVQQVQHNAGVIDETVEEQQTTETVPERSSLSNNCINNNDIPSSSDGDEITLTEKKRNHSAAIDADEYEKENVTTNLTLHPQRHEDSDALKLSFAALNGSLMNVANLPQPSQSSNASSLVLPTQSSINTYTFNSSIVQKRPLPIHAHIDENNHNDDNHNPKYHCTPECPVSSQALSAIL